MERDTKLSIVYISVVVILYYIGKNYIGKNIAVEFSLFVSFILILLIAIMISAKYIGDKKNQKKEKKKFLGKDYRYDNDENEYEWRRVWEYHKEADHLFHQRFSFFLLAESFLVLSVVTILVDAKLDNLQSIKIAISLLGFVFTFGWWYVNLRLRIRLDYLKNTYLKEEDFVYKKYMDCVKEPIKDYLGIGFHINSCILPKATIIFWWFILFDVILHSHFISNIIILLLIYTLLSLIKPSKKN